MIDHFRGRLIRPAESNCCNLLINTKISSFPNNSRQPLRFSSSSSNNNNRIRLFSYFSKVGCHRFIVVLFLQRNSTKCRRLNRYNRRINVQLKLKMRFLIRLLYKYVESVNSYFSDETRDISSMFVRSFVRLELFKKNF